MLDTTLGLRQRLEDLGLTLPAFARTLTAWGDPRSHDVLLRWVQRAAEEDASPNHHIDMVLRLVKQNIDRRRLLRRQIHLFETRLFASNRDVGHGQEDRTQATLQESHRQKTEMDQLLREVRSPVQVFHSKAHPDRYGFCETREGDELPLLHDWQYILGSTLQNLDPPTLGNLGPKIAADIDRWGFAVVSPGQMLTENF